MVFNSKENDIILLKTESLKEALKHDFPKVPVYLIDAEIQRSFAVLEECAINVIGFEAFKNVATINKKIEDEK